MRERLVAGDPAVARAVCAGSRVAGGGDRRKAEARQNARRSRVPGVADDERARPLMERAERIAFVELSDGHNELFRSVVQSLLLRRTLRPRGGSCHFPTFVAWGPVLYQRLCGLTHRGIPESRA